MHLLRQTLTQAPAFTHRPEFQPLKEAAECAIWHALAFGSDHQNSPKGA